MVSTSISLAEDTDHCINSTKNCNRSLLWGLNLVQGLREGFLKEVTFNPRCGRKKNRRKKMIVMLIMVIRCNVY